jgi:hypothetical protein
LGNSSSGFANLATTGGFTFGTLGGAGGKGGEGGSTKFLKKAVLGRSREFEKMGDMGQYFLGDRVLLRPRTECTQAVQDALRNESLNNFIFCEGVTYLFCERLSVDV